MSKSSTSSEPPAPDPELELEMDRFIKVYSTLVMFFRQYSDSGNPAVLKLRDEAAEYLKALQDPKFRAEAQTTDDPPSNEQRS